MDESIWAASSEIKSFKHAPNAQIQIILCMHQVLSGYSASGQSECPDQTARMRRLIWILAVLILPKTRFRMTRPILYYEITGTNANRKVPDHSAHAHSPNMTPAVQLENACIL